jgi:hypothetical protein
LEISAGLFTNGVVFGKNKGIYGVFPARIVKMTILIVKNSISSVTERAPLKLWTIAGRRSVADDPPKGSSH